MRRGELADTLVVYSSDHGEMLGDHSRWGKSVPYQASIGVPLLVAGKDVRAAREIAAPAATLDLAATFLDYAGAPVPADMDSRSLRPLLEGRQQAGREVVLSGLRTNEGDYRLAYDGRYKVVRGFGDEAVRLHDLEADPRELVNLASRQPARGPPADGMASCGQADGMKKATGRSPRTARRSTTTLPLCIATMFVFSVSRRWPREPTGRRPRPSTAASPTRRARPLPGVTVNLSGPAGGKERGHRTTKGAIGSRCSRPAATPWEPRSRAWGRREGHRARLRRAPGGRPRPRRATPAKRSRWCPRRR